MTTEMIDGLIVCKCGVGNYYRKGLRGGDNFILDTNGERIIICSCPTPSYREEMINKHNPKK